MTYVINQSIPYKATGACANPLYNGPYTYAWTFSDGDTATGQYVTHQYTGLFGTVTATVVCTNAGTNNRTATSTHNDIVVIPVTTVTIESPVDGEEYPIGESITVTASAITEIIEDQTHTYQWYIDGVLDESSSTGTLVYTPSSAGTPLITSVATPVETGYNNGYHDDIDLTISPWGWRKVSSDLYPGDTYCALANLNDGRFMTIGGLTTGSVKCYIFDGTSWSETGDLNAPFSIYSSWIGNIGNIKEIYLPVMNDGKVFLLHNDGRYEMFNPSTEQWTLYDAVFTPGNINYGVTKVCLLDDGNILYIGRRSPSLYNYYIYKTLFNGSTWTAPIDILYSSSPSIMQETLPLFVMSNGNVGIQHLYNSIGPKSYILNPETNALTERQIGFCDYTTSKEGVKITPSGLSYSAVHSGALCVYNPNTDTANIYGVANGKLITTCYTSFSVGSNYIAVCGVNSSGTIRGTQLLNISSGLFESTIYPYQYSDISTTPMSGKGMAAGRFSMSLNSATQGTQKFFAPASMLY